MTDIIAETAIPWVSMESMIDALELLIPASVKLNENFAARGFRKRAGANSWYDVVVSDSKEKPLIRVYTEHGNKKLPPPRSLRVEFKDVRLLTKWDFPGHLMDTFQLQPAELDNLKVQRVDFTADILNVPVSWLREHATVKYKQSAEIFHGWKQQNKRGMSGLTFGTHHDLYRIYNKTAELLDRKEQFLYPGMENGNPPPAITRVERQCTRPGVPKEVSTLGQFLNGCAEFDPFRRLVTDEQKCEPDIETLDAQTWLNCEGLRAIVQKHGRQRARKMLNRKSGGKASRIFQQYSKLLDHLRELPPVSSRLSTRDRPCASSILC